LGPHTDVAAGPDRAPGPGHGGAGEGRPPRLDLPSPANPPAGCRFHTRCPWVQETKCATERPPLLDTGDGHKVACHFTAEIEAGTVKQTLATGIEAVTGTETVAAEAVEVSEGETETEVPAADAPEKAPVTVPAQADADAKEKAAAAEETGAKASDATDVEKETADATEEASGATEKAEGSPKA
ncbi:oligopeptide/dipeptide ABC transporter ATP-binding protein, partial [Streptomyces rubiginosohelvolus]|uniref:oligopeptide/dipeptide ABC transporter ATP-binding protein n=1 Tax=Streptomyces rubiginosohelvolus TaxID=67362 RepID=UPI0033D1FA55